MNKILKLVVVIIFFINSSISCQDLINEGLIEGFENEPIFIQYDFISDEKDDICDLDSLDINVILIRFYEDFHDTVEIRINDSLIDRLFVNTEPTITYTGVSIKYINELYPISPVLNVKLPNKKKYMQLSLDNRFKVIRVYRYGEDNYDIETIWHIIYQNFL